MKILCIFFILYFNNFLDNLIILYSYMFIYNLSLFMFFWIIYQVINFKIITIYSFNDLKFNFFFLITLTIIFFSLAGVPPFLGFFSKILILISLINSNFFFFYLLFFGLLFLGLYFYIQNIRFLYSISKGKITYIFEINKKNSIYFFQFIFFNLFFLLIGFFFFEDILVYFLWLLY